MSEQPQSTARHYSLAVLFLLLIALGCVGYLAWENNFYISAGLIAVIAVSSLSGFRMGGIYFVTVLLGTVLAVLFAPLLGNFIEPLLIEHWNLAGLFARMTAIGIGGTAVVLVSLPVASWLSKRVCRDRPLLKLWNGWFGVGLCACQAVCIAALLLGGFTVMQPMLEEKAQDPAIRASALRSAIVDGVLSLLDESEDDPAGRWLVEYNPFEKVPQLKALAERVETMNDPDKLQKMVRQLSDAGMAESPAVRDAVSELQSDPQLRPFLFEGKPLDQQAMQTLMTSSAVLTLMEDPAIQEKLREVR